MAYLDLKVFPGDWPMLPDSNFENWPYENVCWRKTKVVLEKVVSWIVYYAHIRIYICVIQLMVCVYKQYIIIQEYNTLFWKPPLRGPPLSLPESGRFSRPARYPKGSHLCRAEAAASPSLPFFLLGDGDEEDERFLSFFFFFFFFLSLAREREREREIERERERELLADKALMGPLQK